MRSRAVRWGVPALLVAALLACGSQLDLHQRALPAPAAAAPAAGRQAGAIRSVGSRSAPRSAASFGAPTVRAPRRPGPPRILVLGDSLVTLSTAPLELYLRAAGWVPTVIGANGWRLDQINQLYAAIERSQDDWDAVVVWAGNNDILQRNPWRVDLLRSVRLLAAERCGVLVGIGEVYWAEKLGLPWPDTPVANPQAVAFNVSAARQAAAHHLGFVPWQRAIHTTKPWFHWDLLHVTPAGADHAAQLITSAVVACRP